jgi:ankyrin repeat protein
MQQSAASPTAGSVTPEKRLLHASAAGDAVIVRRLLKVIPAALPALFLAVQSNHSDIVTLLLSANPALANSCLANGCSPLYTAASKGFVRVAKALLSHGATVDLPSTSGATALFVACQHGQVAMASALLGAKADPAARDSTGATPLYVACQNGQLGTVDALLRRHGDRSGTGGGTGGGTAAVVDTVGLNAAKASGATPLYVSCQKGEAVIAARLLAAKAAVDQVTATGASALLVASLQGHAAVVDLLLAHNANPDLATRDGTTPIVAACSSDASVAVPPSASGKPPGAIPRALLAAGATVCLPGGKITPSGVTLIAAARRWGDEKLIRSLVRRAAPPAGRQMRPRVSRPSERESEQEEEAGDEADERGHACDDDDSAASSSDSDGETDGEQEDDDGSAGTTDDATSTSDEAAVTRSARK